MVMIQKMQHVIPSVGTILIHKTRLKGTKCKTLYATIVETQTKTGISVLHGKKIYNSMTAAARAAGGYRVNGWTYWKIEGK
jgi:hypothetical protein